MINGIVHIDSPKFVTVQFLNYLMESFNKQQSTNIYSIHMNNTPFYLHAKEVEYIKNSTELQADFIKRPPNLGYLDPFDKNDETRAMEEIIQKFKNNNIKIVIFTTPHSRVFLENLNQQNKNAYDSIIEHLREQNIKIYEFDDKYQDLNIWYDYYHVSINKQALIFDDDIIKIIKEQLT